MLNLHRELKHYHHIIWDMNGTLIDDAHLCVEAVLPLMAEHGLPPLTIEEYRHKFRFPVLDYYRDVGFQIEESEFTELSHRFHERYLSLLPQAQLFDGTRELLSQLKKDGKTQSVLTAAWKGDLDQILQQFDLTSCFDHLYALTHRLADSKISRGHELLKASGHCAADSVLIGDTLHDLEVGQALGIKVILVTGGHMSTERLRAQPVLVVDRT